MRMFFMAAIFIVGGSLVIIMETVRLILDEIRFHRLYGNDWVQVYEKCEEPLAQTNLKIGMGVFFVIFLIAFLWWLYWYNTSKQPHKKRRRRH
jgi:hypothetical protein